MEEIFSLIAEHVALILEGLVILTIIIGALDAVLGAARYLMVRGQGADVRRGVWLGFARWLVLSLEFALAADLIRTAIAPTWTDIGQLAAIAAIRTGLGFFLEKDIDTFSQPAESA